MQLEAKLPLTVQGYRWVLLFSAVQHGFSLLTFYERAKRKQRTVLVVETLKGEVFGGFTATDWAQQASSGGRAGIGSAAAKTKSTYFGTGEAFLFSFPRKSPKPPPVAAAEAEAAGAVAAVAAVAAAVKADAAVAAVAGVVADAAVDAALGGVAAAVAASGEVASGGRAHTPSKAPQGGGGSNGVMTDASSHASSSSLSSSSHPPEPNAAALGTAVPAVAALCAPPREGQMLVVLGTLLGSLCLDVDGGSTRRGAKALLYEPHGGPQRQGHRRSNSTCHAWSARLVSVAMPLSYSAPSLQSVLKHNPHHSKTTNSTPCVFPPQNCLSACF